MDSRERQAGEGTPGQPPPPAPPDVSSGVIDPERPGGGRQDIQQTIEGGDPGGVIDPQKTGGGRKDIEQSIDAGDPSGVINPKKTDESSESDSEEAAAETAE